MPIEITRKGRYVLTLDGARISEHNVEPEAIERAIAHAQEHGVAEAGNRYQIAPPSTEVFVPILNIAALRPIPPGVPAPNDVTPPTAPTIANAVGGEGEISFDITAQGADPESGLASKRVYRRDTAEGSPTMIQTIASDATSFTDSGLPPDAQRFYTVANVNADPVAPLEGPESNMVNATTDSEGGQEEDPLAPVYALAAIWPRQSGTNPTGDTGEPAFPSGHFCLKAYPGVQYETFCRVRGGTPPFVFSLPDTGGASGLSIDADTGDITWASPDITRTFTWRCVDAHGTTVNGTWTVTVTTSGFKFLDASAGSDANAGTLAAPWQTLERVVNASAAGDICYFKNGDYSVAGLYTNATTAHTVNTSVFTPTTRAYESNDSKVLNGLTSVFQTGPAAASSRPGALATGGALQASGRYRVTGSHDALGAIPENGNVFGNGQTWQRLTISGSGRSVKWRAFPGHSPRLSGNFQSRSTDWGALIRLVSSSTNPVAITGFDPTSFLDKCFQIVCGAGHYETFWGHTCDEDTLDCLIGGSNSGMLMMVTNGDMQSWYLTVRDVEVANAAVGPIKSYGMRRPRYEYINTHDNADGWDLKATQTEFEVVFCKWKDNESIPQGGLFGNMALNGAIRTSGVLQNCLIYQIDAGANALAVDIGQDGVVADVTAQRCTFVGRVQVRNVNAGDGPISFQRCVNINADSGYTDRVFLSGTTAALVSYTDNLSGGIADGIVDSDGKLTGASRTAYLNLRGHEIEGVFA